MTLRSLPVSKRWQDIRLSSCGDVTEYSEEPPFRQNDQRLSSGRSTSLTNYNGKRPGCTYVDSTGVLTESGGWTNATNGQPSDDERTGRKERPDEDFNDGVQRYRASKRQVSHVALQTDTCDTLYVTKNTLTAYTIAIVQNSQALQYEQMHAALQTARNEASLETPIRAEELLTAHFNLAVLEDQKGPDINPNAQKSADTTQDAEPSASAPDDQTYVKIPSRYADNSATRRPHPTGTVTPTCRREYGLVNTIPAGYESDDSWDNISHNHEHTHTHNIVPLLTLTPLVTTVHIEVVNNSSPDRIIIQTCELDMHRTHDPGTINRTEGAPAANKLFGLEPTVKSNAGIQYNRLIHRRCASLDLEATFKEIKISQNIEKEVCKQCQAEFCRCPAFTPGTPCSSVSSTPTSTSDEQIPELVTDKPVQQLHVPLQSPSDEEADREVAAICQPSEYYRVRSHLRRRRHYFMYNALDDIGEITQYKRRRNNSPSVQGPPVEH